MPKPSSGPPPHARRAALLRLGALALGLGAALAIVVLVVRPSPAGVREWVDGTREWVDGAGPAGPLAFVLASAALTCALFPGPLLAGASGLLFGTALGFPLSLTAATLGACVAFSISRWAGGSAVEHVAGRRVQALRALLGRNGFLSVLYARIAPGVPYTLVNYAAGLTTIRLNTFAGATALGVAPRAFAYTALGGSLGDLRSPEVVAAGAVLVGMALFGLLLVRRDVRAARTRGASRAPSSPPRRDPPPRSDPTSPTRSGT